jgi:hypothetical protein
MYFMFITSHRCARGLFQDVTDMIHEYAEESTWTYFGRSSSG